MIPLLLLLLSTWFAPAFAADGPTWVSAPVEPVERPAIPAPLGGWWTEDGLYATVHGSAPERAVVTRLADHAATAVPRLADRLGVSAGGGIDVYLAPSRAEFLAMQPGAPPDWADGTAWPSFGLVFLHAPDARSGVAPPLETVLDHEIVHVLLGRAFAPQPTPRWLQEGLAQFFAGEIGPETNAVLAQTPSLLPLAQITRGFPRDPTSAHLAYAESADLIGWIVAQYGESSIPALISALRDGAKFESALESVTGQSAVEVEAAWRQRWDDPWIRLGRWLNVDVLMTLGGVAIAYGAILRRRRAHLKMRRWEHEEKLERQRLEILAQLAPPRAMPRVVFDHDVVN